MEYNHKDKDNNELHTPRVEKQILNNSLNTAQWDT